METDWARRLGAPLALAAFGAFFAVLAVVDKVFGLVQRPLQLATVAYASLAVLLGWALVHGVQVRARHPIRPSFYTAFLILNVLTALYVFAWRRLSADPTPVLLQTRLSQGDALLAEGNKDGAHLLYREAYQRFPKSFPVLMRMGAVNYQLSDFERAQRYFSRAVDVAPGGSRWRALNDLGQTFWKLGDAEEAIRLYARARGDNMPASELNEWHYRMAWAHFDLKHYDEAIEHYQAVAEAGAKYASASYYNIACAQSQKLKLAKTPQEKERLMTEAVANLSLAWQATETEEEVASLRRGLIGSTDERDPELAPLRGYQEFAAFLDEVRAR
jgi:tetratricopeptide (TPR) repeat protein